jgi:DNA-directed RNA polymerase specialized sigma24 family protein
LYSARAFADRAFMPASNIQSQQLAELEEFIISRVNGRLRGWPRRYREDITQEARVAVWRALFKFDPARGRLEAFAQTVVDRAIVDYLDTIADDRQMVVFDEEYDAQHAGPAMPAADRDIEHLVKLLNDVPDQILSRPMTRLYNAIRTTNNAKDAADSLGVRLDAYYKRVSRLRHRLTQLLQEQSEYSKREVRPKAA